MAYRSPLALLAVLAVGLAPGLVYADVPPGPGYVEECTVEKAEARTGEECRLCDEAYYGDLEACSDNFGEKFEQECETYGASFWDEVWCRTGGGCRGPGGDVAPLTALFGLTGLLGIGFVRRRRRRSD